MLSMSPQRALNIVKKLLILSPFDVDTAMDSSLRLELVIDYYFRAVWYETTVDCIVAAQLCQALQAHTSHPG